MNTSTVKRKIAEKGVDNAVSEACAHLKEAGANFKTAAASAKEGASELASENYKKGVESTKQASVHAGEIIREKPLTSIAVAFGAGWLISKLLK